MAALQISHVRLPAWLLPANWPQTHGEPELATLTIVDNRFESLRPSVAEDKNCGFDAGGSLALPPLVDGHVHLDKTFTRRRLGALAPGLLPAIQAMRTDQANNWDEQDLRQRALQALCLAADNGTRLLRTHVDWTEPQTPRAWQVFGDLAADRAVRLQRVALTPLPVLADVNNCKRIISAVDKSHDAVMGGFIHSSNFDAEALRQLVHISADAGVDLDLHIDEELSTSARGFETLLDTLESLDFPGHVVCGHVCALAAMPRDDALRLLDRAARLPISLLALPATNLYLQDACPGETPLARGITRIVEARERGIPCLLASDNVQDAFNPLGNYDPLETLRLGLFTAHFESLFDQSTEMICRDDWLNGGESYSLLGRPAQLVLFSTTDVWSWPSTGQRFFWQASDEAADHSFSFSAERNPS